MTGERVMSGGGVVATAGDQRCADRRRMLKSGRITFNDRHCSLPCAVRDLTATGARLAVDGSISAPDHFELNIELDGTWVECEVAWRRANLLGVRFVSAISSEGAKRKQVVKAIGPTERPTLRKRPLAGGS